MPSGSEALDRLELGSALDEVPRQPLRSWDFWLERRPLFAVREPIGGGVPCSLISTPALLEALLAEARSCPSLRWHPGCRVCGLVIEEPIPRGRGRSPDAARSPNGGAAADDRAADPGRGAPDAPEGEAPAEARVCGVTLDDGRRLDADLVLACDGRSSRLLELAGLERRHDDRAVAVLWFALGGEASADLERWLDGRFLTLVGEGESLAVYSPAGGGLRLGWLQGEGEALAAIPWPQRWARLSPPELAALWRALPAAAVPDPVRVEIRPALARRWQRPGLLLLGDAAHPMSPLRAQGLNMALRDAVVAAEHLLLLRPGRWETLEPDRRLRRLDQALAAVERRRQPEIARIQALQREELERALLLRRSGWLRQLLALTAAWSGPLLARRWQAGQPTLRRGLPLG